MLTLTFAQEYVLNLNSWFSESVWPPVAELWERLDIPEYQLYKQAVQACTRDAWKASQSTLTLLQLTFRPLLILWWIVLKFLWRNLLEHGGKSLQKGTRQLKFALVALYKFQLSLNSMEILGEVGLIAFAVALYYFRKWLQRQTYWSRTVKWCRRKRAKCVQVRFHGRSACQTQPKVIPCIPTQKWWLLWFHYRTTIIGMIFILCLVHFPTVSCSFFSLGMYEFCSQSGRSLQSPGYVSSTFVVFGVVCCYSNILPVTCSMDSTRYIHYRILEHRVSPVFNTDVHSRLSASTTSRQQNAFH
jgi:hypothetical protein